MIPLAKYREAGKHRNVDAFTVQDRTELTKSKRFWNEDTDRKELEFWRWW